MDSDLILICNIEKYVCNTIVLAVQSGHARVKVTLSFALRIAVAEFP